jgi:hypothetical protein
MSRRHLASLAPRDLKNVGDGPVIGYTGIKLGRFSSNLFLYIDGSAGTGLRSAG